MGKYNVTKNNKKHKFNKAGLGASVPPLHKDLIHSLFIRFLHFSWPNDITFHQPFHEANSSILKIGHPKRKLHLPTIHSQVRTVSFREARFPWNKASHSLPLKVKSTISIIVIAPWTCWWIKPLLKNGLFPKDYVSSWWFQPLWKIITSQNGFFFPEVRLNI